MEEENLNVSNDTQENVVDSQIDSQVDSTNNESSEAVDTQVEGKQQQSAEENAKYANIRREYEAKIASESLKAKDQAIADMGMEWNGQPITTHEQYVKAKTESEQLTKEQAIRAEYEAKGLPEEVVNELVESKRDREERKAEKATKAQNDYRQAQFNEFTQAYPELKGEDITKEVWDDFNNGIPLVKAYRANQEVATLKAKLAEYEKGTKAQEVNNKNAVNSTGSLLGNDTTTNLPLTKESIETMSEKELSRRWPEVKKLLNMR